MFNRKAFFSAFQTHGLMVSATLNRDPDAPVVFVAGYRRPSEIVMSEQVQSDEYSIEYETDAVVPLQEGDAITIAGAPIAADNGDYVVRSPPRAVGDGSFTVTILTKVAA